MSYIYDKDLHDKNYKFLMKKIKEDLNKWRDVLCHGKEASILLKCWFAPI